MSIPNQPLPYNDIHRFFDLSIDLLAIISNGYFVRLNPAWEQVLGYSINELLSRPIIDFIHPDDVARTQTSGGQIETAGGTLTNFENRYRRKDGVYIWLEWTARGYAGEDHTYCVARDVTARKQTEQALRQSEQTLREFIDVLPDGALLIDPQGTLMAINQNLPLLKDRGALGKNMFDLLPSDFGNRRRAAVEQVLATGRTIRYQDEMDGEYFDQVFAPIFDENGIVIRIAIFVHDITRLKQTEIALRKSEEQFRSVLESAAEGILVTNAAGDIILVNQYLENQFGYPRDELLGTPVEMLLPEAQRGIHETHRKKYNAHPEIRAMGAGRELMGRRKDGSSFPVEVSLSYTQHGDEFLVMAFVVDISERKQIEQERLQHEKLQVEVKKERELIELRQRFMSMISHEFRTPLTAIASSCEILDHYYDRLTDQQRMERVRGLNAHVHAMVGLLDDILMLNKIQAGMVELFPAPLEVESVCQRVFETAVTIDQGHHQMNFSAQQVPTTIQADRRVLEHILSNLLSNAIKYSPSGTAIDFRLSGDGDWIRFVVKDEGRGIPEADQLHVFEPFQRARNVDDVLGTGLGLTIVKSYIELHGGSIRFESAEGQGTTFWVELPIAPQPRP